MYNVTLSQSSAKCLNYMRKSPPHQKFSKNSSLCTLGSSGSFLSRIFSQIRLSEFICYGFVGLANTAIHALVFFLLVIVASYSQAFANLIAFFVAVTASFFLNAHFTFRQKPTISKFLRMSAVMALLSLTSGHLGDVFSLNPLATFIFWCAISYVAGFLLSRFFVFQQS